MFLKGGNEITQVLESNIHGDIHNFMIRILKLYAGLLHPIIVDVIHRALLYHLFEKRQNVPRSYSLHRQVPSSLSGSG